jgi:hypothetical protein
LTLHDSPGIVGNDRDGNAPMAPAGGVAAPAMATGPIAAIAHVIPAIAVKRLSEDIMSISLCREAGATIVDVRGGRNLSGVPRRFS